MPRRKPKPVTLARDRRIIETVDMQDPMETDKLRSVQRVFSATQLDRIYARTRLAGPGETDRDAGIRKDAGDKFREIWERAGGRGAGSIDYSRVKVDVSFRYEGTPQSQTDALNEMAKIHRKLGHAHFDRLESLIIVGENFYEVAARNQGPVNGPRLTDEYQALRDALDILADYFGLRKTNNRGRLIAYRQSYAG